MRKQAEATAPVRKYFIPPSRARSRVRTVAVRAYSGSDSSSSPRNSTIRLPVAQNSIIPVTENSSSDRVSPFTQPSACRWSQSWSTAMAAVTSTKIPPNWASRSMRSAPKLGWAPEAQSRVR